MPLLELFDETLDINSTENYDLAVQLSTESLSFAVLDSIRNKYILLRSYTPDSYRSFTYEQLDELFVKDDFLRKRYGNVSLITPSSRSTLVPQSLYDPAKRDEYFRFNHSGLENCTVLTNRISDPDSYILFGIPRPVAELAAVHFPKASPVHHLKPLFRHIHHSERNSGEYYIHAHIEADFFDLVIYSNHTLKLCNTFYYRNVSDMMYHILNVFRTTNIGQEQSLWLSGLTERFDDLSSNLSLYIRTVGFAAPYGNFSFSYVFNDTPLHRYLNLFTVTGCES